MTTSTFAQMLAAEVKANAGAVTPVAARRAVTKPIPTKVRLRPRKTSTPKDSWNELDVKASCMLDGDGLAEYQALKRHLWKHGHPWDDAREILLYRVWTSYKAAQGPG